MTGWREHGGVDGQVGVHGQLGGDGQVSEAYGRRWSKRLPDGAWASIQVSCYVFDDNAWRCDEGGSGERYLEMQIEYLVCRDPDEPGGTEIGSEYQYERLDGYQLDDTGAFDAADEAAPPTDAEWNEFAPKWAPKLNGATP